MNTYFESLFQSSFYAGYIHGSKTLENNVYEKCSKFNVTN